MCNCKHSLSVNQEMELIPELEQMLFQTSVKSYNNLDNEMQYEVIGTDERMQIPESRWAPFRYICQITARLSRPKTSSVGTGFFIGPRTILTVAHNIWDPFFSTNGAKVSAGNVEIIPARNGENNKPFGTLKASSIVLPHSDFKSSDMGKYKDYAIIHLTETKGLETGYFGRGVWAQDSIGSTSLKSPFTFPCPLECQSLGVAGYPSDKDDKKANKLYKSSDVALRLVGKYLYIRNDTYKSMSGCPVWMRRDPRHGGRTVVGLLLGAGEKDSQQRYIYNVARYIDDEVRKFITDNYK